ncbi:MAG: hypothetical protein ACOC33_00230 [bacterium]
MPKKEIKESKSDNNYLVFHIDGGLGKNIMATAVVEAIFKKYSDKNIVVVTAWEEPWYNNPYIYRVYKFGNLPYFYEDYIFDNTKIFRIDPYHTEDFLLEKKHLIQTWCELYDVPYNGEEPKLYLNPREIEIVKDKIKLDGRPIFILQTNGGAPNQYDKKSWARDMPLELAQKIVDDAVKAGMRVLHIRREDQPALNNVEWVSLPLRELFATFLFSTKRLLIDSFGQHASKALGLDSVVCWISNTPKVFGYENNLNVLPKDKKNREFLKYSYLDKYDITGNPQQFPYDDINVFDINEIFNALNQI